MDTREIFLCFFSNISVVYSEPSSAKTIYHSIYRHKLENDAFCSHSRVFVVNFENIESFNVVLPFLTLNVIFSPKCCS